ncbi:MAG: rhodanese-like domain-containing protein [Verrucomicrobia bacterium]|nr:rhodanese-like domain-containing protein [Verrucomicrobiota bacterium]
MKTKLLMSLIAGCCAACAASNESLPAIKQEVAAGRAVLVDVREKSEWDAGHLKSARLLPLSRLETDAKAADGLPKDKPVYVHCRSGARTVSAVKILKQQGFDARGLPQSYSTLAKEGF